MVCLSVLGFVVLVLGSVSLSLQYTAHRHRNKNWCAFIVHKNVSCSVRADNPAVFEAEAAPCAPHQLDCDPSMTYRTHLRPTYKISYKTVTELEWRCCPGYQGPDCKELKGTPNRHIIPENQPHPQLHPEYPRNTQRPERRETAQYNRYHGVEKTRHLEEEVQRLSQTVLDLQAAMGSMSANLRTDLQEDASKMLVTLLNNMHSPDNARTGGTEESAVLLDGHQTTRGLSQEDRGMEHVLARLNDMADALKSKDEAIEELRNTLTAHVGQIQMLMEASQGPAVTVDSSSDIGILQDYIDTKFEKLKNDLLVDMKDNIAKLKSTCDDRILSLQKTCRESQERHYDNLTKILDRKEADLRKEFHELLLDMAMSDGLVRTHRQTAQLKDDDSDVRQAIQRVAEAHQVLNARFDNELKHLSTLQPEDLFSLRLAELEDRMNVTEKNAETYCFYVEEKLTKELADEIAKIRQLLNEKLGSVKDQFTAILVDMSNNSFPGMFSESVNALQTQVNNNKYIIQGLEDKFNSIGKICSTDCKSGLSIDPQKLVGQESIAKDVKKIMKDLDVLNTNVEDNAAKIITLEDMVDHVELVKQQNSDGIQDIHKKLKPLADNMSGLTGAVTGLGDAVSKFSQDLQTLNSSCCLAGQVGWVHRPSVLPPLSSRESKPSPTQVEELRDRLDKLSTQLTTELSLCKKNAAGVAEGVSAVDNRVATLEGLCGKLDDQTNQIQNIKKGLERDLAHMNSTLQSQAGEIRNLKNNILKFQMENLKEHTTKQQGVSSGQENLQDSRILIPPRMYIPHIRIPLIIPQRTVPDISRNPVHQPPAVPLIPRQPYGPVQPSTPHLQPNQHVLVTGEAGPPGYARHVPIRRERGSIYSGKPVNGFAGGPGYPQVNPVSYKPQQRAVSQLKWNPAQRLVATPVASERHLYEEPFSFSAGLTQQALLGDFGIIRFNKVLVNDGGHYNPETGIFTVPVSGRYMVSAVLVAPRRERVEAVLSVSEHRVQKLDSAGYGGLDEHRASRPCQCGGSAALSLVLSLRAGDHVALVRTAGALALSEAREILSTFSAVFLYSPQAHR
ncbi:EMILIN-2 [Trichomycterus rosablanca]|uniref:EMILIN-2 n=1 Tax=Trichomycterus rosablanca TaxID=2290929 RepID=UPI002F35B88D